MFGEWESDIISYFEENQLDIEKVKSMKVEWGIDCLKIQTSDGLIALRVGRGEEGEALVFPTEHTNLLKKE